MRYLLFWKSRTISLTTVVLILTFLVACGAAAPGDTEPTQPQAMEEPTPVEEQSASPSITPTAEATPVSEEPTATAPSGTLNVGLVELGAFLVHPTEMTNPQIFVQSTAPIGESLLQRDINREVQPLLAESWEISDDFLTWTFHLQEGVQFHKGYGEMTADDVFWSMRGHGESQHARAGQLANIWAEREGSAALDPHTVQVHTGEPIVSDIAFRWFSTPGGTATYVASEAQTEELGVREAGENIAATGPWEIAEHRPAEFWRMEAVEDHWRHTPHFAELVFRELPEESSRLAGFQTGNLDTVLMNFESIPVVEEVEGARLVSIPNAIEMGLRIYGNWYPMPGIEQRPGYDSELPWVSADPDFNSPDWEQARMVREALAVSIDREALVDTILRGYGNTDTPVRMYTGFEDLLEGRNWEYDPDRARQLLADAGYADGFEITLTPSIRGAPAEVESCEAIAQMWGSIGLDVKFQRVPYNTLRPTLVSRSYQGATCHAGSPLATPATGYSSYLSENPFNRGVEHPWMEEKMLEAQAAVNTEERRRLEAEIGQWLFDNAMTDINYYSIDAIWPVGPRIEEWTEHVRTSDLRQINGYEFIRHRQP